MIRILFVLLLSGCTYNTHLDSQKICSNQGYNILFGTNIIFGYNENHKNFLSFKDGHWYKSLNFEAVCLGGGMW